MDFINFFTAIFILDDPDWGEVRASAMCLNALEPSVHLNLTHINTNLSF